MKDRNKLLEELKGISPSMFCMVSHQLLPFKKYREFLIGELELGNTYNYEFTDKEISDSIEFLKKIKYNKRGFEKVIENSYKNLEGNSVYKKSKVFKYKLTHLSASFENTDYFSHTVIPVKEVSIYFEHESKEKFLAKLKEIILDYDICHERLFVFKEIYKQVEKLL